MILFFTCIIGCSFSNLRIKQKGLEGDFIKRAIADDYSFLNEVKEEDLDSLVNETYNDVYEEGIHTVSLLNVLARWDEKKSISKFVDTIDRVCKEDSEKKNEIAIKCLEKAFLYKSINFIEGSFRLVEATNISKEQASGFLVLCLNTEDERKLKIRKKFHQLEEDLYESLDFALTMISNNDYSSDILTDEIVTKILLLDYIDVDTELGTLDLIVKYKQSKEFDAKWIENKKLTNLIMDHNLIITAANLIEIADRNKDSPINKVLNESGFTTFLKKMKMEWGEESTPESTKVTLTLGDPRIPPLWIAAQNGDVQTCEMLIKRGADIEASDHSLDTTPLWIAAQNGHVDVCKLLIKGKANIESNGIRGRGATPLFIAAMNGHKEVCNLLLKKGANINHKLNGGVTPLFMAAQNGYNDICEFLIGKGANKEDYEHSLNTTPLGVAAQNGHASICKILLDNGAKVDKTNKQEATPLFIAAMNGHKEVCKILLEKGADINYKAGTIKATPLLIAAEEGHINVCNFLLTKGAGTEYENNQGVTPLFAAAMNGNIHVCNLLIERGANINHKSKNKLSSLWVAAMSGQTGICKLLLSEKLMAQKADIELREPFLKVTPIWIAAQEGQTDVCELLLDKGANIEVENREGVTPLLIAVKEKKEETCKLLIERGANINHQNKNGFTSLWVAAQYGFVAICEILLKEGANPKIAEYTDNITPLWIAAQNGHADVCKLLLKNRAEVDSICSEMSMTPLLIAARNGHTDVCNLLLDNSANIEATNKQDETPLFMAARHNHPKVCKLLLDSGANANHGVKFRITPLRIAAISC